MILKTNRIKRIFILFLPGIFLVCLNALSLAGNKQIVEETVQEMDELNKQAVQQIPDIPEKGRVDIKANITYEREKPVFDIYYKKITTEKDSEIKFNNNQQIKPSKKEETVKNDSKDI